MDKTNNHLATGLRLLFEVELHYLEGKPPVTETGKVGDYLGSGEGRVSGPEVNGAVHWSLFEAQGQMVCESNLVGVVTTEGGAEIRFDTMGFFMRPDPGQPQKWVTSAAVSFETQNEAYTWLNALLEVWEDEFDMESYRHSYRAYVPITVDR